MRRVFAGAYSRQAAAGKRRRKDQQPEQLTARERFERLFQKENEQ